MSRHHLSHTVNAAQGFALFAVILLIAIISLISVAMVNVYLINTRATTLDIQRLKVDQLLDSGIEYAALSLASPRVDVFGSAIPSANLIYASPDADVVIDIRNEAGFIDLLTGQRELLESVLQAHGALQGDVPGLINAIQGLAKAEGQLSYRNIRETLGGTSVAINELLSVATLHNGKTGVHPELASEKVLALVPRLSKAERDRILSNRNDKSPSLISNPIENDFFTSSISAFYRIRVSVTLDGRRYSRLQIIKMINQRGRLYEVQATL